MSQRGSTTIGCLGWALILAATAFIGSQVGEPYYRYYRYRDAISQQVRFAGVHTDSAIRKDIWAAADSLGMPEEAYHLDIVREQNRLHISGAYDDSWSVFNYTRPVPFTIEFEKSL